MRKERLEYLVRRLLIAALLVSAVLLLRSTGYYGRVFERFSGNAAENIVNSEVFPGISAAELVQAVHPRTVLVRMPDGATAASAYAGEETEAAFHLFSAMLSEALGSAGAPERIDEDAFRGGIDAGCVLIDFFCEEPLEVLARWLGSDMHSAAALSRTQLLYLGLSNVTVQLCYQDAEGRFYRCATAAMSETLRARLSEFQGGAAYFAYETNTMDALRPYTVLLETLPAIPGISGSAVRDGIDAESLLQTVEMNRYVASSYVEADGTRVFIDNEKMLRINPDGTVFFRAGAADGERRIADGTAAAASYAYAVALHSIGRYAGQADILLTEISETGDGAYTVQFDYCVGGVPLRLPSGSAASVELKNGRLAALQLAFRSYAYTEEIAVILPMRQAAAIANAAGAAPALVYADAGDRFDCVWVKD